MKVNDWITFDIPIARLDIEKGDAGHICRDCGDGYWEVTFYSPKENRQVQVVCWQEWIHERTVEEARKS